MKDLNNLIANEIEHPTEDDIGFLKLLPQYFHDVGDDLQMSISDAKLLFGKAVDQIENAVTEVKPYVDILSQGKSLLGIGKGIYTTYDIITFLNLKHFIRGFENKNYNEAQRRKYAEMFRRKDYKAHRLTNDLLVFCGKQDDERKSVFFTNIVAAYLDNGITLEEMEQFFRLVDRLFVEDLPSLSLADANRAMHETNMQIQGMEHPDLNRLTSFEDYHKIDDAASSRLQAIGLVTVIYLSVLNGSVKTAYLASELGHKFWRVIRASD